MNKLPIINQNGIVDIIYSKEDKTVKYVFIKNNQVLELSWIDKSDGKAIICVPTQTSCALKCKFCFLSELNIPVYPLTTGVICNCIFDVLKHQKQINPNFNRANYPILLISFMGCGEPLNNLENVIDVAYFVQDLLKNQYDIIRFAIASLVPRWSSFDKLKELVVKNNLLVKFHYSLHTCDVNFRKELMPGAATMDIPKLLTYLETGNSLEIHYTIMDGVNDTDADSDKLIELFKNTTASIKLLRYSEKKNLELKQSGRVLEFMERLTAGGIKTEYYEPPGNDVGSSCGQFLLDYYKKYT